MDVTWEDPPPRRRDPQRVARFLDELRAHPGKWALYTSTSGSETVGTYIRKRLEELGAEVRAVYHDASGTPLGGRCRVYARWPEVDP